MAAIQIERLAKQFDGTVAAAVHDLSLDIAGNRFVTLLGPSGCGKTTTLRLIGGFLKPDAGTIRVDGALLSSPETVVPPERRAMGMVFQNYAVWPHKTVYENVAFGLQIRRLAAIELKKRVAAMLELVGLGGFEKRLPSELSGGQQQRVALARSLVVEPGILLLDEPLSNLDAKLRERMRTELKQIQRRTGITFVYVTHDQAEALALSDEIAVIDRGRLRQFGAPREIYARPANRVVADFMGQVSFLPGRVAALEGGKAMVDLEGGARLSVAAATPFAVGEPVDVAVRPENIRIHPAGAGSPGALRGTVVEHTYLGNANEYVVEAKAARLRVQTHPSQLLDPGDTVTIEFDAEQCCVFGRTAG
jgi:iron(III) transport system ATP-binding protein